MCVRNSTWFTRPSCISPRERVGSGDETNKKPGRPGKKGAALTSGIRNVRDNDIKLSCTLLHELCPILNMNFDLWRVKANSCLWEVALADFNYSLYVHVFGGGGEGVGERRRGTKGRRFKINRNLQVNRQTLTSSISQMCISSTVLCFATSLSTPPSPPPTTSTLREWRVRRGREEGEGKGGEGRGGGGEGGGRGGEVEGEGEGEGGEEGEEKQPS